MKFAFRSCTAVLRLCAYLSPLVCGSVWGQTACTVSPSGLVGWWKGDGNVIDSVGTNNGTLYNTTNYAVGEVQQSFIFNGVDQWAEIPDSPSLNPTNALTVEAWVYVSGNPNTDFASVIYKFSPVDASLNQYELATHYINGQLHFFPVIMLPGWTYFDGNTVVQFNTWYRVAMTYDGSSLRLYVNGALDGSIAASGIIAPKPVPLRIGGASTGPWFFNGRVDEVSLYNRALSASEVQSIYTAGAAGKCLTQPCSLPLGLVSWWRAESNALDSVSGNNGLFTGASYGQGEVGEAFDFNLTGNNVRIPASPSLNVGAGDGLTIEASINPPDSSYGRPIVEWVPTNSNTYAVHFFVNQSFPGVLYADLVDTASAHHVLQSASGLIQTNLNQHVGLTYDKATGIGRLYLNGMVVQEASLGTFTPQTTPICPFGTFPAPFPLARSRSSAP